MHNKKKRRKKVHVGEKVEKRNCTRGWREKAERRRSSWNPTSCNGNEARTRAYMVRIDTVTRLSISIDLSQSIQTVDPARR